MIASYILALMKIRRYHEKYFLMKSVFFMIASYFHQGKNIKSSVKQNVNKKFRLSAKSDILIKIF